MKTWLSFSSVIAFSISLATSSVFAQDSAGEATLPEIVVEPNVSSGDQNPEPAIVPVPTDESSPPVSSPIESNSTFSESFPREFTEQRQTLPQRNNDESPTGVSATVASSAANANAIATSNAMRSTVRPSLQQLEFGQPNDFSGATGLRRRGGSLFDSPVAASITTRQELSEKQATSTFDALRQEVGVLMQRTAAGQASPFIRGVTGQQVLILIDGIRLNNSIYRFGPNQYFNTVDPAQIDHVEVLRGQGSVLWGSDAIGGAINLVTRGSNRCCGHQGSGYANREIQQTYNSANAESYTRFNLEGWSGDWGVFAGASYLNAGDLETGFGFGEQPGTNYDQYAGDVKLNFQPNGHELFTFALQHFEQSDVPRSDRFPGFPGDRNLSNSAGGARFFDPQQRDLAYIRYEALAPFELSDAIVATASYHRQREIQTRGIPTTRFQETDVESIGLNLVSTKELGKFGKLSAGVDWYHDDVDSNYGGSANGPIVPDDAFYERFGAFLNWDVRLSERLAASTGARYEQIDVAATPTVGGSSIFIAPNFNDWIAQVGLAYEITPCLRLVGSISEGFRAPNLDELTANNPNVLQDGQDLPSLDLVPERSVSYELGIKTNVQRFRSQLFVYWLDLDNNIVPVSAGANQFRRANQDSLLQGTEFDGVFLLNRGWSVYGNLTYTFGRNEITVAPLSRIPPTQGVVGLRWRGRNLRNYFSIYTWMVRRQDRLDPVRDLSDERIPVGGTPGFATLNMRFGHTFGCCRRHRVSLNLENLTDKAYLVHGSGVFGSGFTARLGYGLSF